MISRTNTTSIRISLKNQSELTASLGDEVSKKAAFKGVKMDEIQITLILRSVLHNKKEIPTNFPRIVWENNTSIVR